MGSQSIRVNGMPRWYIIVAIPAGEKMVMVN